jgi:deoxyribose-phosphate aldolase
VGQRQVINYQLLLPSLIAPFFREGFEIKFMQNISGYIVHAALKPTTLLADIEQLCAEAVENKFTAVCVPPLFVLKAKEYTTGTNVKVATVIGFPFGYSAIESKLAEILLAIVDGADEMDMVINIAALKNNDWQYLANEINSINPIVKRKGKVLKVIIETGLLTDEEIIKCCDIYGAAGIDFIETSTGFAEKDVTTETVGLIRKHLADPVKIIAAGGIKTYSFAKELINAGADRISSSNSLQIITQSAALN